MRRTVVAAAWILGSTLPLLAATVFLVGCCVLPFHGMIHKMLPLCQTAAAMISGHHHDGDHDDDHPPATPAKQKEEPVKRMATEPSETFQLVAAIGAQHAAGSSASARYRSFISLGATRCDQDVGLNVLVHTLLI
jgi:hypothetical protein